MDQEGSMTWADDSDFSEPVLYNQRWVQLGILSLFALISDWVCFSNSAIPNTWETVTGHGAEELIDIFLLTNVISCFCFTDISRVFGLRKCVLGAAALMTVGCFLRSGVPFMGMVSSYDQITLGTILVGAAQPVFQCYPPQLSATWFGNNERSLATAIAINFNQVGIATAFIVGGFLVGDVNTQVVQDPAQSMGLYLSYITIFSTLVFGTAFFTFQDKPASFPSASAAAQSVLKEEERINLAKIGGSFLTYPATAKKFLQTNGFGQPLAAFVGSIAVTNTVSAFTADELVRAGITNGTTINIAGACFQLAIVAGGIFIGGYVDRTKKFKEVTMACLAITLGVLCVLAVCFGETVTEPQYVVLAFLLGLGFMAGPIQAINAELAVEVTYPSDENAVEATQQLSGNLFSALLVPVCVMATKIDIPLPIGDTRGDTLVLAVLICAVFFYFSTFDAPLKREMIDREGGMVDVLLDGGEDVMFDLKLEKIESIDVTESVELGKEAYGLLNEKPRGKMQEKQE